MDKEWHIMFMLFICHYLNTLTMHTQDMSSANHDLEGYHNIPTELIQ